MSAALSTLDYRFSLHVSDDNVDAWYAAHDPANA